MSASSSSAVRRWNPGAFLSPPSSSSSAAGSSSSTSPQAMVILNLPIARLDVFCRIWSLSASASALSSLRDHELTQ